MCNRSANVIGAIRADTLGFFLLSMLACLNNQKPGDHMSHVRALNNRHSTKLHPACFGAKEARRIGIGSGLGSAAVEQFVSRAMTGMFYCGHSTAKTQRQQPA